MCHYTHLTPFEREKILFFLAEGKSITEIAHLLKRSKSTISRELRRNAAPVDQLRHHGKQRHKKGSEEHRGKFVILHPIEERPASAANRSVRGHGEADIVVGKQGKACLVTLVDQKSLYLLGGKAMSKTAAAVNRHTIHGSAGPMKTPMAFYGSSSRKARTSRIRQRITSNGSTIS